MHDGVDVRKLADDDLDAAWQLGRFAFGASPEPPPYALKQIPGMVRYGAFDAAGRLVGKAADLHHEQWWSGRRVVAADVGGVAVLPEARGGGVARALLTELLRGARERGAAVSTLYPTISAPYRSCGWEVTGTLRTVELATATLPRHRPADGLSVRPAVPADRPAVTALYERVVRHRRGPLTRQGVLFDHFEPADALPYGVDGLTLVERDGELLGYAAWNRGRGYDSTAVLTVEEVLTVRPDAARTLLGVLASWCSVAPTLRMTLLPGDAVAAQLPLEGLREQRQQPWMHRPVDVVRAVRDRGWPAHARGQVDFVLEDPVAPWNAGSWRLEVADGSAQLEPASTQQGLTLSARGFALLYAGAARADDVVQAGLLRCAAGHDPAALDLLGASGPMDLLDYF